MDPNTAARNLKDAQAVACRVMKALTAGDLLGIGIVIINDLSLAQYGFLNTPIQSVDFAVARIDERAWNTDFIAMIDEDTDEKAADATTNDEKAASRKWKFMKMVAQGKITAETVAPIIEAALANHPERSTAAGHCQHALLSGPLGYFACRDGQIVDTRSGMLVNFVDAYTRDGPSQCYPRLTPWTGERNPAYEHPFIRADDLMVHMVWSCCNPELDAEQRKWAAECAIRLRPAALAAQFLQDEDPLALTDYRRKLVREGFYAFKVYLEDDPDVWRSFLGI
ncbi:hypothetical protein BDW74DRAFT_113047 [Aspergillus multicolor]|uniref:uncharacterized protein n=1 Tax=Aspergillus multicolor TaxID=41759 RepID=UPI003CCDA08A